MYATPTVKYKAGTITTDPQLGYERLPQSMAKLRQSPQVHARAGQSPQTPWLG